MGGGKKGGMLLGLTLGYADFVINFVEDFAYFLIALLMGNEIFHPTYLQGFIVINYSFLSNSTHFKFLHNVFWDPLVDFSQTLNLHFLKQIILPP